MAHRGLTFGTFIAPFHRIGENPTLAIDRDIELIQWLDHLGYDEAWIGEHHSAGWETIAAPELIIAAAAEKTKYIKLGSGVTSLPYHHPFMVAQRWVQLDHMTRGRAMLGCGPGALPSDAYMLGIPQARLRPRMLEGLDAIMRLLKMDGRVTMKTDWFEMVDARLHLAPYSDPYFDIAVASTLTPSGMIAAGTHGVGVLSLVAGLSGGLEALAGQWQIAEDAAAKAGTTVSRKKWRLVVNAHVAKDDAQAMADVRREERRETIDYFEETLGRPPGRADDPLRDGIEMGTTLVGSPETVIKGIRRLLDYSQGGFGGLLFRAHEWANREQIMRSYELFARYVMPVFQQSLDLPAESNVWAQKNRKQVFGATPDAMRRAFTDAGARVPADIHERSFGARDVAAKSD
jgi:limonene 1,2-monooxygenase